MKKLKFISDTFQYKFLHPNGMEILTVDIPQSCVTWKTVQHNGQDMPVPNGFDDLGETLIRVARYNASCVTKQYQQDLGVYHKTGWERRSYFKSQQLQIEQRKKEMFYETNTHPV